MSTDTEPLRGHLPAATGQGSPGTLRGPGPHVHTGPVSAWHSGCLGGPPVCCLLPWPEPNSTHWNGAPALTRQCLLHVYPNNICWSSLVAQLLRFWCCHCCGCGSGRMNKRQRLRSAFASAGPGTPVTLGSSGDGTLRADNIRQQRDPRGGLGAGGWPEAAGEQVCVCLCVCAHACGGLQAHTRTVRA